MFTFIFRKMLNNKWMIISLLIGNILLCSLVSSIPLYSDAILQRMLTKQLEQQQIETNRFPGTVEIKFNSLSVNRGYELKSLDSFEKKIISMELDLGVPLVEKVTSYSLNPLRAEPVSDRQSNVKDRTFQLRFYSNPEDHINIVSGEMYSDTLSDGVIEVIVNERTLVEKDILIGEVYEFATVTYPDGSPIRFKVTGVYENKEKSDPYWVYPPSNFSDVCLMSERLFKELFIDGFVYEYHFTAQWFLLFDYAAMSARRIEHLSKTTAEYKEFFDLYGTTAFRANYLKTLDNFSSEAARLNVTLWVLQVPIFILLAFFIFMVSKQILEQERNTIAVLKSRGSSRAHIIVIFLVQSLFISTISAVVGIPIGLLICRVIGAANGFLNLVQRSALQVRINPESIIYTACAALLSVLTMVIPAFSFSKVDIVDHKRQRSRKSRRPLWQRLFLDVLLFGVSLYGYYNYNNQKAFLISSDAASLDPLLFISSSLFIIGAGLLFLRVFPYLIRLVYEIGKKYWSPSLYASFLKVIRSVGEEQFIMIFLVLTVANGIFNAKAARTINLNMEENIRYLYGADIVVMEEWRDNSAVEDATMRIYFEPDFEKYKELEDKAKITKVLNSRRNTVSDIKNVRVMGINTKEFGQIAWFRNNLLPAHWYRYLNTLASDARAVLVSSNFQTKGYKLGDYISVRNENGYFFTGIICGFFDFWPTYYPTTTTVTSDGRQIKNDEWLVVGNLSQIQSVWGVTPYEIWMKADSNQFIYEFAEEKGIRFSYFADADASIINEKNDPVLQGTNGVLTVGFIIILIVCMTGFLIYWILSIRSRELQFGIFRAMGLSMRSILSLLLNEQIFISGISVALGTATGQLASELFVPLIQLGYAPSTNTLPLRVVAERIDYINLFTTIGVLFVICMIILGYIISKIKIAQALKLGED
ncbi:MAG: FtsX-like permease family protein [Clostridiales bacterium]|nr:FtsX-like permease family protein [Clostridiales bacterium]